MPEGTDVIQDGSEMQKIIEGDAHFHRLGWKCVTVILIINAIALDSLSLPAAFASLGMVAGVLVCIGIGFIAIYTSLIIGQVKLEFPAVAHYVDIGRLMMGGFGAILVMFVSGAILVIFYLPPVMWFVLLKEGAWYDRENIKSSVCNGIVFVIGITIIGCSTYASIVGMVSLALDLVMNIKLTRFSRSRSLTRVLLETIFMFQPRGTFPRSRL
ncbi:hypothetical protein N7481_004764 [Penicillium waksmanii]|uniref:uncharacterized protein n=1 Tax=Penicillium waksmanii TaxID=69791 RepID=UPI00254735C9|nr:uncharacterized protein N7481_004764 [Penicillium waksmanii]KAJ5989554.1 hypothetical protein N7481_004764 [Penicillium waksmanii]